MLTTQRVIRRYRALTQLRSYNTSTYNFETIEKKWEKVWQEKKLVKQPNTDEKKFILSMFPYPSGNLHMGHVRVYTISDMIARYYKLKGFEVIHPMGWDAFGLPAENAAIERGIEPSVWTEMNINTMKEQFKLIHTDLDWEREVNTSREEYYKHTQQLILMLYEKGLLYRKKSLVNWDPVDKTVLANEQVDAEGKSWRSGAVVEKKYLEQWYVRITEYSEQLLKDLDQLNNWPERVKLMQENWIGKAEGCKIEFQLKGNKNLKGINAISVFTTRAETIEAVTFIGISYQHELVNYMSNDLKSQLKNYNNLKYDEIKGFNTGLVAINPITKEEIPIYVVSYVLSDYKLGAVMAVPGHDKRDYDFAMTEEKLKKNIKVIIKNKEESKNTIPYLLDEGEMNENIKDEKNIGLSCNEYRNKVIDFIQENKLGNKEIGYKLRDWLISRQRQWGAPMPFIHCKSCGILPVKKESLPIKLNEKKTLPCPKCNKESELDSDTMDTFVDSSWYYLRFLDNNNEEMLCDVEKIKKYMPVDLYIGGIEHAILHLLYSRFIFKFLTDYYKLNEKNEVRKILLNEPFDRLLTQGMVQGKTYKLDNGRFVKPDLVDLSNPDLPKHKETLQLLTTSYEKMSKSKYNGIDPKETVSKYGVDATRLYILFKAAPKDNLNWEELSIVGMQRYLQKIYQKIIQINQQSILPGNNNNEKDNNSKELLYNLHLTIQQVDKSILTEFKFNSSIAYLIKFFNLIEKETKFNPTYLDCFKQFLILLAPFAPSSAEEYYSLLRNIHNKKESIFLEDWPQFNEKHLILNEITYVLQINGKKRSVINLSRELPEEELWKQSFYSKWN
ncbi:leucyl-tRNA synthetase [Neoconidiobolus thromboides FSU 785]|nr:leucyl-tRNA synthetase [Neoconidiobolus thromboides FSU 785]